MIASINLSDDQQVCYDAILNWRSDPARSPYLTVGGYAGTGKTTLISCLMDEWEQVASAALCGKAAHVLRSKGVDAQTIHSLIYVPFENEEGKVRFRKRKHLDGVQTIVVDEASMIDHLLLHDLLSFGIPVLFVGDHGQLEPIGTNPKLMVDPKLRLEKIHRQAMDNPILRLATAFREGRQVPYWTDPQGRVSILSLREFDGLVSPRPQILCGFNKTRHKVNARIRAMLGKRWLVEEGERLICLKNNKIWNIFNGQQVTVTGVGKLSRRSVTVEIETDDGRSLTIPCAREQFGKELMEDHRSDTVALMDYGYCLTVHKSQGSEWDEVLVLEELTNAWDARRWRYTAATRAKERLTYCK